MQMLIFILDFLQETDFHGCSLLGPFFSLAASVRLTAGLAIGPVGSFVVANKTIAPDGSLALPSLLGNIPWSPRQGRIGDNFRLTVIDQQKDIRMLEPTSIHWHGLFQNGTNYMDGPSFINQCPISPGNSFTYDFTSQQSGTFWYHSHLATQYCDETVVGVATPSSMLINGLGRTAATVLQHDSGCDHRQKGLALPLPFGQPCLRLQLRLPDRRHKNLTIIEADGILHQPLSVDSIQIYAAQRYSFILTANSPSATTGFVRTRTTAPLVSPGYQLRDSSLHVGQWMVNEVNLHPLVDPGAPGGAFIGGADVQLNLALAFDLTTFKFTINGVAFVPPTVPVLLQILSGAQNAQSLLPNGSVYTLPHFASVEVTLAGGVVVGGHPFHLHGHAFDVIRSAGSTTYNYVNPARRDVVNIGGAGDNVTIRFFTDNRGPWFLHCHIDWHLEAGFAIVFAEDVPDWKSELIPTAEWNQLCPIYNALPASITSLAA
ncbi:unnamed protein product [Mycena citricolor]|uniref:laccase n=1 Tax=Mycena citricolor TaxID=2018698 RepID=A0AAD2HXJ2_9AGAR|nr:unnamed protein product [Mycena citricolor]